MSSAEEIANGFTITGLLDASAKTQRRYPVVEIPLDDIADHPENVAYSMDETGIARLADSIREQGLTDLPLVRKLEDGTFQMVSGHRRKAAYELLSNTDEGFDKIPCRVADGVDDGLGDDAPCRELLHTNANHHGAGSGHPSPWL